MKRGTPDHPKVFKLAELLNIRRPMAVGYLELLFHFTATYAPQGDVGRYDDKRIAAALDWPSSPAKLIDGLIGAGWIDRHRVARLVVHDWHEHADDPNRVEYKRTRRWFFMKAAGGEIARAVRQFIFRRDEFVCLKCGYGSDLTIDHIIPITRGGTNAIDNLRTLCRRCNSSKKDQVEVA